MKGRAPFSAMLGTVQRLAVVAVMSLAYFVPACVMHVCLLALWLALLAPSLRSLLTAAAQLAVAAVLLVCIGTHCLWIVVLSGVYHCLVEYRLACQNAANPGGVSLHSSLCATGVVGMLRH
jgi:hypothetical protein